MAHDTSRTVAPRILRDRLYDKDHEEEVERIERPPEHAGDKGRALFSIEDGEIVDDFHGSGIEIAKPRQHIFNAAKGSKNLAAPARSPCIGGALVLRLDPLSVGNPAAIVHVIGKLRGDFPRGAGRVLAKTMRGPGDSPDGNLHGIGQAQMAPGSAPLPPVVENVRKGVAELEARS